jgi:hypothetical protein
MTLYADLELGLHRRDAESYAVELRFSHPESDADIRPASIGAPSARFDFEALRQLALRHEEYGRLLGTGLLHYGLIE